MTAPLILILCIFTARPMRWFSAEPTVGAKRHCGFATAGAPRFMVVVGPTTFPTHVTVRPMRVPSDLEVSKYFISPIYCLSIFVRKWGFILCNKYESNRRGGERGIIP